MARMVPHRSRRPAIVTLALGRGHQRRFRRYGLDRWQTYARRIGADLIVFRSPLDQSARARARSAAWQKCLAVAHWTVRERPQVAWLDSDIVVRPDAPSIFETTPLHLVGAVDAYQPDDTMALQHQYAAWRAAGVPFIDNPTPETYHTAYGLPHGFPHVVQAGVMVCAPEAHAPLFRHVYDAYEERGGPEWNYEMRPLSYELQRAGAVHWIDPRFNAVWGTVRQLRHADVPCAPAGRAARAVDHLARCANVGRHRRGRRGVQDALRAAYFLHFAGAADDMAWAA